MEKYFLGGYFLIIERPIDFGTQKERRSATCSDCINDNLLSAWAYSWTRDNDKQLVSLPPDLRPSVAVLPLIRRWVDGAFEDGRIGWLNVFATAGAAREYLAAYFPNKEEVKLMGIYFSESEADELLEEFRPVRPDQGGVGLYSNLMKRIPEMEDGQFLGFDIIGIECGGDFHSFHCHDLGAELCNRFGLTMNKYGLFEKISSTQPIIDYMNDEANGFEPVPWFICKVKLVPSWSDDGCSETLKE